MPWGPSDSVGNAFAITPNDATVFPPNASSSSTRVQVTRALWIGGAGNLNVTMISGDAALFSGVPAGTILPIQVKQVLSTNTTATLILGLY